MGGLNHVSFDAEIYLEIVGWDLKLQHFGLRLKPMVNQSFQSIIGMGCL